MNHDWERLSFVHRKVDAGALQRRLPAGLTLDLHGGDAWVGLVLFELRVAPTMIGAVPRAGVFGEVNVRTYVLGPDGTPGIWFLSLDAPSLSAVVVARRWYGLPYHWSAVSTVAAGDAVSYGCIRHGTGRRVHGSVAVEVGPLSTRHRCPLSTSSSPLGGVSTRRGAVACSMPMSSMRPGRCTAPG